MRLLSFFTDLVVALAFGLGLLLLIQQLSGRDVLDHWGMFLAVFLPSWFAAIEHIFSGITPGRYLFGLRLILTTSLVAPTGLRAFVRAVLCFNLPILATQLLPVASELTGIAGPFPLLILVAVLAISIGMWLFTRGQQMLHDSLAGTVIVRSSEGNYLRLVDRSRALAALAVALAPTFYLTLPQGEHIAIGTEEISTRDPMMRVLESSAVNKEKLQEADLVEQVPHFRNRTLEHRPVQSKSLDRLAVQSSLEQGIPGTAFVGSELLTEYAFQVTLAALFDTRYQWAAANVAAQKMSAKPGSIVVVYFVHDMSWFNLFFVNLVQAWYGVGVLQNGQLTFILRPATQGNITFAALFTRPRTRITSY